MLKHSENDLDLIKLLIGEFEEGKRISKKRVDKLARKMMG
jgi:hypothetical protein